MTRIRPKKKVQDGTEESTMRARLMVFLWTIGAYVRQREKYAKTLPISEGNWICSEEIKHNGFRARIKYAVVWTNIPIDGEGKTIHIVDIPQWEVEDVTYNGKPVSDDLIDTPQIL